MKSIKIILILSCTAFLIPTALLSQGNSNPLPILEKTKTIEVKVKGVGCAEDIKSITANVEKLNGVSSCKTLKKGATTKFEVYMLESLFDEKAIYKAIEDTPGCKNPKDRPYKVKL